jgi:hypothetical protein
MFEAGEDPRFIARRLVILASEDIGLADPTALTTAVAAAQAVQLIGMPEARLNLAQATIALARGTEVQRRDQGDRGRERRRPGREDRAGAAAPARRPLPGLEELGHGTSYTYSHDEPYGIAEQQYAPDVVPTRSTTAHLARRRGRGQGALGAHPADGARTIGSSTVTRDQAVLLAVGGLAVRAAWCCWSVLRARSGGRGARRPRPTCAERLERLEDASRRSTRPRRPTGPGRVRDHRPRDRASRRRAGPLDGPAFADSRAARRPW